MKPASSLLGPAAATLAMLTLAACYSSSATRLSYVDTNPGYSRSIVQYASSGAAMPLEVRGATPGIPAQAIAAGMRLPGWFEPKPFALGAVEGAPSGNYRVVMVINPDRPVGANRVCGDVGSIGTAPGPELKLQAAFCAGGEVLSQATAFAPNTQAGTAEFQDALNQMTLALFPPRNPIFDDDRRPNRLRIGGFING